MNKLKSKLLILLLLHIGVFAVTPPDGWQFPKSPTFESKWNKSDHKKYLITIGDFNGDNKNDTAVILEKSNGNEFGIFVYISSMSTVLNVFNTETHPGILFYRKDKPELCTKIINDFKSNYGITNLIKGQNIIVCGKKPWDCDKNITDNIELKYDAISFFQFGRKANVCYYFNNKINNFEHRTIVH